MCEKARKKLAALIKRHGQGDAELQKMEIICDEFQVVQDGVKAFREEVKTEIGDLKSDLKKNTARTKSLEDRLAAVEGIVTESQKLAVETHGIVNRLFEKWGSANIEQDSAVAALLRQMLATKAGKVFVVILLGCFGLALAYIAEHIPQLMTAFN